MRTLATLYSGSAPQRRTFVESEYARFFDEVLPLRKLAETDLSAFDGLFVPSRLHIGELTARAPQLRSFLDDGGTIATFGQQPEPWLPDLEWTYRPTNFWWWLEPDGDSGLRFPRPTDEFFDYVPPADCEWHFHGSFDPPREARVLIRDDTGGAVLYVDDRNWDGTAIVAALDPTYHFGSYFMPATDRFLSGFLPWLRETHL
ncbi:hypothetical protein AB7C87_15690 [Natrarchaeobius sp. A-rgal3]|uniref:hypothetical protein n=1 Tax=Natrarchaeobius versutus TaxID=1679078 RepID=UPI00351055A5